MFAQNQYHRSCGNDVATKNATARKELDEGWHVIWTRSNCEQMVRDELLAKNYEVFLPMLPQWSTRQCHRNDPAATDRIAAVLHVPMFKGYLFVRNCMDKEAYIDICSIKGVVKVLGQRWDRPARVPDDEIQSIRKVMDCRLPLLPYPYLRTGEKVRIERGTLATAEGILVAKDQARGLFVVSVSLLQCSVAVEVDFTNVAAF